MDNNSATAGRSGLGVADSIVCQQLLKRDLLRLVAQKYRLLDGMTIIVSVALAVILSLWVPTWHLVLWSGACIVLATINISINQSFLKKEELTEVDLKNWSFWSFGLMRMLATLVWTSSVLFFRLPEHPEVFAVLYMFVIGSMIIHAVLTAGMFRMLILEVVPRIAAGATASLLMWYTALPGTEHVFVVLFISSFLIGYVSLNMGHDLHKAAIHQLEQKYELEHAMKNAEAANKAKSAFLSVMSHEIKTPLNGILTAVRLLRRIKSKKSRDDYLDVIDKSGNILLSTLSDVLDLSVLETGNVKIKRVPTDLGEVLESTIVLMKDFADKKGLQIEQSVDPRLPQFVLSDPSRLRQVLTNLTENAVKHTDEGEIRLSAVLIDDEIDAGDTSILAKGLIAPVNVEFTVSDTGHGIAKQALDGLFEKFAQVDDSNTREHEGSGLGLAICKEIVTRMGGDIGVESLEGEGTTFRFNIPADPVNEMIHKAYLLEEEIFPELMPIRILLAEDNLINQKVTRDLLESFGHKVDVVANGAECIGAVQRCDYELVLMDVRMPKMSGVEAARKIRQMKGARAHIPIVALSAQLLPEEEKSCEEAGMNGLLLKPLETANLFRMLARYLPEKVRTDKAKKPALAEAEYTRGTILPDAEDSKRPKRGRNGRVRMAAAFKKSGEDEMPSLLAEMALLKGRGYAEGMIERAGDKIGLKIENIRAAKFDPPEYVYDEVHQIIGLAGMLGLADTVKNAREICNTISELPQHSLETMMGSLEDGFETELNFARSCFLRLVEAQGENKKNNFLQ